MLKLVSVNIEQDKHHDKVIAFLDVEKPDVVCFQEIFKKDIPLYEKVLDMKSFFVPLFLFMSQETKNYELMGIAIFAKEMTNTSFEYYVNESEKFEKTGEIQDPYTERESKHRAVMWVAVLDEEGFEYKVSNTHFTWTPEGLSTKYQVEDATKLKSILENKLKDFVLVGDMNAPRGRETFSMFASVYKDNIPAEYDSSLDPVLHRVPTLRYMVDALFTTPEYGAENVRLVEGVSDHKAVVGDIYRV